jgi:hypothetical protein
LFEINPEIHLEITVLGSYKNWSPLPTPISELIDWGKPDLIAFDPKQNKIIFAVEETAAVPTGNQALQRCERIYGSLRYEIPFWYLIGEFGVHKDGGIRRDSIWPTILSIKLSCIKRTPCIVLHYSDFEHPEDYSVGSGVNSLFKALATEIGIFIGINTSDDLLPILTEQYGHMLSFIKSQYEAVTDYIPQKELLDNKEIPNKIAELVTSKDQLDNSLLDFFNWEKTEKLPKNFYEKITPCGLIKQDKLVVELEKLVKNKSAYNLSSNAGSRPQKKSDIDGWIKEQENLFKKNTLKNAEFSLDKEVFPVSNAGNYHVTTAKNTFYLADSWQDIQKSLKNAYKRLDKLNINNNIPVFVYLSNSLKPGRIFGDPFTGQLSAFANIFSKNVAGNRTRISIAYYPHQVHTQLFDDKLKFKKNKGITIMRELLDYAVFHGGVFVNLKTGEIL